MLGPGLRLACGLLILVAGQAAAASPFESTSRGTTCVQAGDNVCAAFVASNKEDAVCPAVALCVAASPAHRAEGTLAASGSGPAEAANGIAVSGSGPARGIWAFSAAGDTRTSCPEYACIAASGAGSSAGGVGAASGTGSAASYNGPAASVAGDASCTPVTRLNCMAASGTGDATGYVAVSATGHARGTHAVSGCDQAGVCRDPL